MKETPSRHTKSHVRILEAAARRFREQGFHKATVAAIMADAGLTVGGFYAHFAHKEELFIAALHHAMTESFSEWEQRRSGESPWEQLLSMSQAYASPEHFAMIEEGCPAPALLAEVARSGPEAQTAFTQFAHERTARLLAFFPPEDRAALTPLLHALDSLLIGAISLARASRDPLYVQHILTAAQQAAGLMLETAARRHLAGQPVLPPEAHFPSSQRPSFSA